MPLPVPEKRGQWAESFRRALLQAPWFDARWYLDRYPHVAEAGWHPADHYLAIGHRAGHATGPHRLPHGEPAGEIAGAVAGLLDPAPTQADPLAVIDALRVKLLGLGFTEPALADLAALATDAEAEPVTRALAARELALWQMRMRNAEGYRAALDWIEKARAVAGATMAPPFLTRLRLAEMLCLQQLGRDDEGRAAYGRAALAGEADDDLMLARATLAADPGERLAWINAVLARGGVPALALRPDDGTPPYDRLTTAQPPPPVTEGPLVTVLVAAWQAGATLPTALRALQEQNWQNLEILVLDDASPGPETAQVAQDFAARDPRIRLIRMDRNGGAYMARNHGLAQAKGAFVTLHDADDWAHPLRIETQMRHLRDNPDVMGCLTLQARIRDDLRFTRWTGDGHFIIPNTSSFLFRREPVLQGFGGWDRVRISADNELIRRIRRVHGPGAVVQLQGAPLAFQRDSDTSVVADEHLGINGFLYGARRAYAEAQTHHRDTGGGLDYADTPRPFPVPALIRADRPEPDRHVPVVLGSEFRMQGGSLNSCIEEIRFHRRHALPIGLVEMFRYDLYTGKPRADMLRDVRALIDGEVVQQLVYGEDVRCDLLILRYPPCLWHDQRYLPKIEARAIKVIVNQPPLSDYGPDGVVRYDIASCAANIRRWFGRDATWHPIGPMVRDVLETRHGDDLRAIDWSAEDWHNIIDLADWAVPVEPRPAGGVLRIGRHARDHWHKWPGSAEDILAAYPDAPDVAVQVLGGAGAAAARLGGLPGNWLVHPFGAMAPRDFLAGIDVWIYFAHPDWVESFGRTIIEAMAAGVPVILPEDYRPVFRQAALYATPQTAVALARRLMADPAGRAAQIARARDFVAQRFSHDSHAARLRAAGVALA